MTAFHIFGHNFPDSWSSEHSILPKTRAESGVDAVTTLANDQDCSVAYSIFPDFVVIFQTSPRLKPHFQLFSWCFHFLWPRANSFF